MKIIKLFFAIAIISVIAVSCKETKKEESAEDSIEVTEENVESTEAVAEEEVVEQTNGEANEENTGSSEEAEAVESTEIEKEVEAKAVEVTSKEVEKMVAEEGVMLEKLADTPVVYPGCEGGSAEEIRACSIKMFKNFLGKNFDKDLSSALDLDKGEHKIRALLKIDKAGKVTVRKIVASRVELENELIRIIEKLPTMTAATKAGSPVDVSFVVPLNFKVEGY